MAKASLFLAILCDCSTVSVNEQEVSYLRAVAKGVVTLKMHGIQRVACLNTQSIHKAIEDSVTVHAAIGCRNSIPSWWALGQMVQMLCGWNNMWCGGINAPEATSPPRNSLFLPCTKSQLVVCESQ